MWAVKEYPPTTRDQAILSRLGEKSGVTIRIYQRAVGSLEQDQILSAANRKNTLMAGDSSITKAIEAQGNIQDVADITWALRNDNSESLIHCAVFIELRAPSQGLLQELISDVSLELTRAKVTMDNLILRQKEGFLSVSPLGSNQFGTQFERILPASAVANLFPFCSSGKIDPGGMYIGRDKFGSNILVDLDRRSADKTNANVLVLGNSGMGKSHLLKLLMINMLESGKRIICLDPEDEYGEIVSSLGGSHIDFMSGKYIINLLEPKEWNDGEPDTQPEENEVVQRKATRLSQHIAFLKDFFRTYKEFSDSQLDIIEILLMKLYGNFGITDETDFDALTHDDYPILSDFYDLCEETYANFQDSQKLFTQEMLREICLGLFSICKGHESKFFNGKTNILDDRLICFGVKGLLETNQKLKNAMLFNILSYMNHALLSIGNTVAIIDELYLFLSNQVAIEYIRNQMKRVRKKNSSVVIASQNIEDFLIPSMKEMTKPLFSIPTHSFLFNPGQIDPKEYSDTLQLDSAEYEQIRNCQQGVCLFRCGSERYLLDVKAPDHKFALFGKAGGK